MKSVSVSKYNKSYFEKHLTTVDYSKKVTPKDFKVLHRQIANFLKWKTDDFIVDFGCGNAEMTLLLCILYKCKVLGIDYSKEGIKIANRNLNNLLKNKSITKKTIRFLSRSNNKLPHLKNVDGIYMADVIEHLYDPEIDLIMKKFSTWGKSGMKIVIHTDNAIYVRKIRPLFDLIGLLTGAMSLKELTIRNQWEKERHVNLTTPERIIQKVEKFGFKLVRVQYSLVSKQKIKDHLGRLNHDFLVNIIYYLSKYFSRYLPSFYLVLEKI